MIIVKIGGGSRINVKGIVVDLAALVKSSLLYTGLMHSGTSWPKILGNPNRC